MPCTRYAEGDAEIMGFSAIWGHWRVAFSSLNDLTKLSALEVTYFKYFICVNWDGIISFKVVQARKIPYFSATVDWTLTGKKND